MKVEINGKTYCVETLIAENERLRKDVIASAKTNRLVLDKISDEIEEIETYDGLYIDRAYVFQIIDKYRKGARNDKRTER